MSVMVKEIFEAFIEAGASEEKAKAAAGVVPVTDSLAAKLDMSKMEVRLIKWMVSLQLASLVLIATFIRFL